MSRLSYDPTHCTLSPPVRGDRPGKGYCRMPDRPVVAGRRCTSGRNLPLSGTRARARCFFSGCSLGCVFCQNEAISQRDFGREISVERLREIFWALIDAGAHNIDLVNPTHYAHVVAEALSQPLPVPVVWNSGGYDRVETLRALEGTVDIYLPDYKYPDARDAQCWAGAADYPQVARAAIQEMVRQTGPYVLDQEGILQGGGHPAPASAGTAEPGQGSDGLGAGDLPAPHRALFPDESVHPLGPGGGISSLGPAAAEA